MAQTETAPRKWTFRLPKPIASLSHVSLDENTVAGHVMYALVENGEVREITLMG